MQLDAIGDRIERRRDLVAAEMRGNASRPSTSSDADAVSPSGSARPAAVSSRAPTMYVVSFG